MHLKAGALERGSGFFGQRDSHSSSFVQMPELPEIFAKWEEAKAGMRTLPIAITKDTTLDEIKETYNPTILDSVEPFLRREIKSGKRLVTCSHDLGQLDGLGLLPTSKIRRSYVVYGFLRCGGVHDLILLDEDKDMKLRVIAIRYGL
jgi:hypothetical protein